MRAYSAPVLSESTTTESSCLSGFMSLMRQRRSMARLLRASQREGIESIGRIYYHLPVAERVDGVSNGAAVGRGAQ